MEVLELDALRVRVSAVSGAQAAQRMALARDIFEIDPTVQEEDFAWAAKVSVGLDRLADDFALDSLAYYHRGLEGEQHERLGAGLILGASLLTARGIPTAGEYELRTSLAMLITDRLGGGGSFTPVEGRHFPRGGGSEGLPRPARLALSRPPPPLPPPRGPHRQTPRPGPAA